MARDHRTMELNPDGCFCIQCGQLYYMVIKDLEAFENEQWRQKQAGEHEKILAQVVLKKT